MDAEKALRTVLEYLIANHNGPKRPKELTALLDEMKAEEVEAQIRCPECKSDNVIIVRTTGVQRYFCNECRFTFGRVSE